MGGAGAYLCMVTFTLYDLLPERCMPSQTAPACSGPRLRGDDVAGGPKTAGWRTRARSQARGGESMAGDGPVRGVKGERELGCASGTVDVIDVGVVECAERRVERAWGGRATGAVPPA